MIRMHQRPIEPTRTPDNNCRYEAEAIVNGQRYSASSRKGVPFELARVLVAAGVPDQSVTVAHEGLRGETAYRSLHWMAQRTIEESARTPVHEVRYREYPGGPAEHGGEAQNRGSTVELDHPDTLALEPTP